MVAGMSVGGGQKGETEPQSGGYIYLLQMVVVVGLRGGEEWEVVAGMSVGGGEKGEAEPQSGGYTYFRWW